MARVLLLLSFIITIAGTTTPSADAAGFSLELIHPFSPRSPLYPGNLTKSQLAQRLIELSHSRISSLKNSILQHQPHASTTAIRPPLIESRGDYLVVLNVGTGPGQKTYYLVMDTGSSLTWTQCLPCDPCFPQNTPTFDPSLSPSYHPLSCDDPLCVPPYYRCQDGRCTYTISYADNSQVKGIVSRDTFTFPSSTGQMQSFSNLAFGCTQSSTGLTDFTGAPSGIFGLDAARESFMTQLIDHTRGRFSYCLRPFGVTGENFMRFGDDIVMNGPIQRTPLSITNGLYYINLLGFSIGNHYMHIPPEEFGRRQDGTGGCVIDSGSSYSYMVVGAYYVLASVLEEMFRLMEIYPIDGGLYGLPFDECYALPHDNFDRVPSLTLHLQDADLLVEPEQLFFLDAANEVFCLAVRSDPEMTDIGAHQQFNKRFTYDIVNSELSFVADDCRDP